MGSGLIDEEPLFSGVSDWLRAREATKYRGLPRRHGPQEIWDHWVGTWRRRVREGWDNVIQVTGPARCGKSTLALRAARALDPSLDHSTIAERLSGSAEETVALYRRLKPGQVGIYDESILGLQSTEFSTAESKTLTQVLNTAGVRQVNLFLLIPHRMDLNKAVRDRRVQYWIKCSRTPRGKAYVHTRADLWDYDTPTWSGLKLERAWSPLTFKSLKGTKLWDTYDVEKRRRLDLQLDQAIARVRAERAPIEEFQAREELEKRVRGLLEKGWTRRQIHEAHGISPNTISRIHQKVQLEKLRKAGYRGPAGDGGGGL